jgi:hypothetical protein
MFVFNFAYIRALKCYKHSVDVDMWRQCDKCDVLYSFIGELWVEMYKSVINLKFFSLTPPPPPHTHTATHTHTHIFLVGNQLDAQFLL